MRSATLANKGAWPQETWMVDSAAYGAMRRGQRLPPPISFLCHNMLGAGVRALLLDKRPRKRDAKVRSLFHPKKLAVRLGAIDV